MSPALLLTFLVAGLLALLPVWRLHRAGWPSSWLATAWVVFALGIVVGVRFPGPFRLLLPILILLYVAPFVAGPERLSRVLGGRRPDPGVIIDVTPRPAPGLPDPRRKTQADVDDGTDDTAGEADDRQKDDRERPDPG
ncbi:MAG: MerC domain-containing protein [Chloroflexota bacterium]|nr:MerC domain-containing protein [Chloroflexota bacterium]